MPVLRPYEQQAAPQGTLDVQASPQDFGSQIAQGISAAGEGIGQMADAQHAVEEQKGQVWAVRAASDARLAQYQQMQVMQTDPEFQKKYGQDGSGFVGAFKQQYEDFASTAIAGAPTPLAAKYLDAHMREMGNSLLGDAMQFQAVTGAKWAANNISTSVDNSGRAAFLAPQKFGEIQAATNAGIDAAPHLDEATRLEMKKQASENVAFAAGKGAALLNPAQTLAWMKPEEAAKFTPTSRMKQVVNGVAVQLPQDAAAPLVKPYNANQVQDIVQKVKSPSPYDEIFQKASQAYGVDPQELKMRAVAESGLDPKAVSSQGAQGIMQFDPKTAESLGVDPHNPQEAIFGAAKLLSGLHSKAGGDSFKTDQMYYGGEAGNNWGPNTLQYAENLAAVRATMMGGEAVKSGLDQTLASIVGPKEAIQSDVAPAWFNQLPWEKQFAVIEDAKQGVIAEQTREKQVLELQNKVQEMQQKKTLTAMTDAAIDGTLTVDQIRKDPTLDYEGKKAMLEMVQSNLVGPNRKDPTLFNDAFNKIHLPDGDPNKITDERQLLPLVGKGINLDDLDKLRKEIDGRGTQQGEVLGDMKKAFLQQAKDKLVSTNMFKSVDPTQAANYYNFQQAFLTQWTQKVTVEKKNPYSLLDPKSPDYLGGLIDQFNRTPQQQMKDMAAARRAQSGADKVKVVGPDGKAYMLPSGQLNDALKQGYRKAE